MYQGKAFCYTNWIEVYHNHKCSFTTNLQCTGSNSSITTAEYRGNPAFLSRSNWSHPRCYKHARPAMLSSLWIALSFPNKKITMPGGWGWGGARMELQSLFRKTKQLIKIPFYRGPAEGWTPVIKCRPFLSFFQRYIVRDISLTEIYRWLSEILSAIWKALGMNVLIGTLNYS